MNLIDRSRAYFRSSKEELLAVSWPTRQDIIRYTGLVIATVIAFGIFFTALDFVVNTAINAFVANKTATTQSQTAPSTTDPSVEINPTSIQATTPSGAPAEVKIEQVPVSSSSTN